MAVSASRRGPVPERALGLLRQGVRAALVLGVIAPLALAAFACSRNTPRALHPIVAVSVAPQAYVVKKIAGDLVEVNVTLPPGVEAHAYEPSLLVLSAISDASLYVKVGHPKFTFEQSWLRQLLRDRPGLIVVDSMRGIVVDEGDPHVWLAPSHVREIARNVAEALSDLLPDHRGEIAHGLRNFEQEVDTLDADIRRTFADRHGNRFFVFHPAWGYFAKEYGLVQVAIEREGREPDPKMLATIISEARAAEVRVIYVQPQHSSASASLIADEIGARLETIDPLAYEWTANLRSVAHKIAQGLVQ
jgi:zinc transport system substrate-binding protein